jgi:hypothetical protein
MLRNERTHQDLSGKLLRATWSPNFLERIVYNDTCSGEVTFGDIRQSSHSF